MCCLESSPTVLSDVTTKSPVTIHPQPFPKTNSFSLSSKLSTVVKVFVSFENLR